MTQAEHDKWELYYEETARKDFERWIYEQCDREDAAAAQEERK